MSEVAALTRAHELFAAPARGVPEIGGAGSARSVDSPAVLGAGRGVDRYRQRATDLRSNTRSAARTDTVLAGALSGAKADHAVAQTLTRQVLDWARADAAVQAGDSPLAQREALRRRVIRLRTQYRHVLMARRRAARRVAVLRALRYGVLRGNRWSRRPPLPVPDGAAGKAVRAALSRLGRPYVWGATGPDQFDCSGLVQWAYGQAGVRLDRTTYDQIDHGIAVPRSQVRPGDLVFPNPGHVQLAIGNGRVIEAPHAGATVRISALGNDVVIRRPLP